LILVFDFKFRISEDTPFVNIEDGRMFIEKQ